LAQGTVVLPDPPASLAGPARAFYDELREMLDVVSPSRVDAGKTSVQFDKHGLKIALVHAERDDWHEHFFPPRGTPEERPWTTQAVDFVAELVRGEVEVETTFRGNVPVSVTHFNRDENGERSTLGHTGFLTPGRLLIWKPKRTETEQASFL
jgi:hypothetical protein